MSHTSRLILISPAATETSDGQVTEKLDYKSRSDVETSECRSYQIQFMVADTLTNGQFSKTINSIIDSKKTTSIQEAVNKLTVTDLNSVQAALGIQQRSEFTAGCIQIFTVRGVGFYMAERFHNSQEGKGQAYEITDDFLKNM
jgi:hypothetical protein